MKDLMQQEFEKDWGFTNEEQECYFIPELNCYGSARLNKAAESKSRAWVYFQRGWNKSRECLVIEIPNKIDYTGSGMAIERCREAIHSVGVKTK